jgi:hypothetical protein
MLPGVRAGKRGRRAPSGAKAAAPAGLALLAGAAGMAFKNRDKLLGLLPGRSAQHEEGPPAPPVVEPDAAEHVPEPAAPAAPPPPAAGVDAAPADVPPSSPPHSTPP